jgi:hypothetical protein
MDTDDVNTAQNYILINHEGIAFGDSGLLNPPTTAIGIDGQIISGTGYFNSLVTNLISSSLGESLDLSSNNSITMKVQSAVADGINQVEIGGRNLVINSGEDALLLGVRWSDFAGKKWSEI